ncbi:MAG: 5-fold beta-flower protein [Desulfobaccales bacterium]
MPFTHVSGLRRGPLLFLAALGLLVTVLGFTQPVSAGDLKAYRGSGSMVFKTDGSSLSNAHGATVGKIEGDSYYSGGGSLRARLDGQRLYNASGSLMAKVDGSSIYNAQGSLIGKLDNESLSNAHGATIGKIEGAGGLSDPATVFLSLMLLGIF